MNYLRVFSQRCTAFYLLAMTIFEVERRGFEVGFRMKGGGAETVEAGKNDDEEVSLSSLFLCLYGRLRVIRRSNISLTIFMAAARVNRQPQFKMPEQQVVKVV